ncbi:MAG: CBS domain-containing protein [Chloroflexi bacterium]|nr:MAG: CBS domain-containing protein [Chloroflexota bacterium]MBL1194447.1 CBS domain-containing protein [Chloroflexota bacterium]NOH11735.1 CBS domain-containing protein [Chloroflexota bacterium]
MSTVNQILGAKGKDVWSIGPDEPVLDALKLMAEKDVGALLVLHESAVVGILSERDYARKIVLKGKRSMSTPVSEIMTKEVIFVQPEASIRDCMELMTSSRIRHLPVMNGNQLIGLISIGDVVREIISDHEMKIEQLENYIKGY